ncbi:HNH/endonuclease VII fold toxin-2 domain-containing protein [uncultured Cocleimonas sp.]|uniref:HNH/endonuclease VII fold toxin-2 domain-containing protein n=1 Tax=uncultured Cocleimonas sp. TaxID=1051587 RepID=UPI002617549D|nr:HNH/endonuclease VII fold toxin-2 domain-containing protein [uncultured Cocleimonas sp.]
MSCNKELIDCKGCSCTDKKTNYKNCCPKECKCMDEKEYESLRENYVKDNKGVKEQIDKKIEEAKAKGKVYNYPYTLDKGFVTLLCEKQYTDTNGTKKDKNGKDIGECELTRSECQTKSKCHLMPYSEAKKGCCPGQTGHHVIPGSLFREASDCYHNDDLIGVKGISNRDNHNKALTVCVAGSSHSVGTHGLMHLATKKEFGTGSNMDYETTSAACVKAHSKVFNESGCDEKCLKEDLDKSYEAIDENNKELDKKREENNLPKKNCTPLSEITDYSRDKYGSAASSEFSLAHLKELIENEAIKAGKGTANYYGV